MSPSSAHQETPAKPQQPPAPAPPVLYGHPFSSYTQKVLTALYENATPFEFRVLGPDAPQHAAEWLAKWPLRQFPLLVDGAPDRD